MARGSLLFLPSSVLCFADATFPQGKALVVAASARPKGRLWGRTALAFPWGKVARRSRDG